MAMVFVRNGLALALLFAAPDVALADTPPVAMVAVAAPASGAVLDPDRLTMARQIIAVLFPPAQTSKLVGNMLEGIMRPMKAQLTQNTHIQDPGLLAIFNTFFTRLQDTGRVSLVKAMPEMTEAMAHAYVRMFSREDLVQVLAFAQTPAGAHYLSRSTEALQDPDVQAYNGRLFAMIQTEQAPLLADFKTKVIAYLAAHPDVAKGMAQAK